jgi:LemA protein
MEWLIPVIIVVVIVAIIGIYLWATYNSLVTLNVRVDEAWSDITVQLKRRADLIPNLIETVRGYAAHEKGVFESVTQARAETLSAQGPAEASTAENHMQSALKSTRSCRRARTSCDCRPTWSTPKTRSRPRAGSTTAESVN